eukprot:TRINITY_DN13502_c0_g1_i1.p1 TRINITY_DN13502_c0_g1~~TRINITY_DN13502_c0_g1_i1.p1  ORF type:complete len:540 (+),score=172.59 TRINITY_DN13502_c0_g1_i1:65-1684(+)
MARCVLRLCLSAALLLSVEVLAVRLGDEDSQAASPVKKDEKKNGAAKQDEKKDGAAKQDKKQRGGHPSDEEKTGDEAVVAAEGDQDEVEDGGRGSEGEGSQGGPDGDDPDDLPNYDDGGAEQITCTEPSWWTAHMSGSFKRIYRMTLVLSKAFLDKFIQKELPKLLTIINQAQHVELSKDATARFVQETVEKDGVMRRVPHSYLLSIAGVTFKSPELGIELKDQTFTIKLLWTPDAIEVADAMASPKPEEPEAEDDNDGESTLWRAFYSPIAELRHSVGSYITTGLRLLMDKAVTVGVQHKNFKKARVTCNKKALNWNMHIMEPVVSDEGDLGIGLAWHEAACDEGRDTFRSEEPLLLTRDTNYEAFNIMNTQWGVFASKLNDKEARIGFFFEDGFLDRVMNNSKAEKVLEGVTMLSNFNSLMRSGAGHAAGIWASVINTVLWALEASSTPHADKLGVYCERASSDGSWFWKDASVCMIDASNKGGSVLDALWTDEELQKKLNFYKGATPAPTPAPENAKVHDGLCMEKDFIRKKPTGS